MITATVIGGAPCRHPSSGKERMKVTVAHEYAVGGESYPSTDIWGPVDMPAPQFGETIQWGSSHIWFRGERYAKPEYDSATNAPLH